MIYEEALKRGQSKLGTLEIVRHVGSDPERFKQLMSLLLKGDEQMQQRASWPVMEIAIHFPALLKPYYRYLIPLLENEHSGSAVKRHLLRIFAEHPVSEVWEGRVLNVCMRLIPSEQQAIAVRAFSITVAADICRKYPEIQRELLILLETVLEMPVSAAIQVRIKRAIKDVKSGAPSL
jgi:hypothetical protein